MRIGQSSAVEQLARLRDGGLLAARRAGKTVYYRAGTDGIAAALAELQGFAVLLPTPR